MAQFENIYPVDLSIGPAVVSLKQMFISDVKANRVGAIVTNNGESVELSGTCSGTVLLEDGSTVAVSGGVVQGNTAYIELPAGAYSKEGRVEVFVTLTDGTTETTLVHGYGNATRKESSIVIDPGTIIPSVSALIQQIESAIASIPSDYSNFYSEFEYATGLKRITGWNNGKYIRTYVGVGNTVDPTMQSSDGYECVIITCSPGDKFTLNGTGGWYARLWAFTDADYKLLSIEGTSETEKTNEKITAPKNAAYLILNRWTNSGKYCWYGTDLLAFSNAIDTNAFEYRGNYSDASISTAKVGAYSASKNVTSDLPSGMSATYGYLICVVPNQLYFLIEDSSSHIIWYKRGGYGWVKLYPAGVTSSQIAPVSGQTATRNYAVGDLLCVGDQLYKVTSAITSGQTISAGSGGNVTATTVAAELAELRTLINNAN